MKKLPMKKTLGLALCAGLGWWGLVAPALAQEYVLPSEEAEKRRVKPDPDKINAFTVEAGKLEIIRLPIENIGRATIISALPEVADIHVETPNMIFIMGRLQGETTFVIADQAKNPIYTGKVKVVLPDDQGG